MGFQDFNSIFTLARRFIHFFKELFTTINTRYFPPPPPSELMPRTHTYWRINQDVQGMEEACTSRYYISPRPGNQCQTSEVTETTQICVRSVKIVENLDFGLARAGEDQAIKQQKLEGGRVKQIVKANHLNLPHKLSPGMIDSETNLSSSGSKEDRKVYVRQTTASSPSVADMVKRFESRTGQVYIQQTTSSSSSASHSTKVAEMVKQFESKPSETLPKTKSKQCTMTESLELESISGNCEELQNEEHYRQRMGLVKAQHMNLKAQPVMKHDLLPVHKKVGRPLTEVMVDSQMTEENMYKRYREESQSAKKLKEARVVQKQVRKMKAPKEKENIYRDTEETASAKKMKEWRVVQKQIMKTMVLNAKLLPKFDRPFFPQRSSKGTASIRSPNLLCKKQRSVINCSASSSPASKVR